MVVEEFAFFFASPRYFPINHPVVSFSENNDDDDDVFSQAHEALFPPKTRAFYDRVICQFTAKVAKSLLAQWIS